MMNRYLKEFLHRGLIFGGFGPLVVGAVYWIVSVFTKEASLTGAQVFMVIFSGYLLAFLQAGASVFNQIESWPIAKSLICHFGTLYLAYVSCYLLNSWIPFEPMVVGIFTAIFALVYLVVWFTVYLCVRSTSKKLNKNL